MLDHPYVSYEDALTCTGLETLSSRRHNSCVKFISKLRSEEVLTTIRWHILREHNLNILIIITTLEYNQLTNLLQIPNDLEML